ncbi:hypothetical protein HMPREF0063_10731 [Aeromicrobium marinum DSM 15272]|uniref:Uncharacterized protein n=1 Tax=Aeromicrobium marinum DSM 15272 TaxID=585531 RepID=E2S9U1_9ACTN|nr:DMT family transporter [Aeromicrobium marinum]EFQ84015.1 hypothetical protein HMPREF0063_10731 [Aeromicrobium marinum DSM 15272]
MTRLPAAAGVPLMLIAGAAVALQSRVNGVLAQEIGEGLRAGALAAVVSFGSGLAVISLVVFGLPAGRASSARLREGLRQGRIRWPELLGGLSGAYFVASQGIAVGVIGVALFIVAFTAGQSLGSLAVDHLGYGPGGRQHASPARVVAAVFAVAGVLVKAFDQISTASVAVTVGLAALALGAGAAQALQHALNGRVSAVGGPLVTTANNFAVGTLALLVFLAVSFGVDGRIDGLPASPELYLGGVFGITFIVIAAITVQQYGVLVLGLCMIAGQVVTAELVEILDPDVEVGVLGLVGGGLAVTGVLVALALRPRDVTPR